MNFDSIIVELSIIVVGAAALGTLFLYAKQPIIVAYIAIGILAFSCRIGFVRGDYVVEMRDDDSGCYNRNIYFINIFCCKKIPNSHF